MSRIRLEYSAPLCVNGIYFPQSIQPTDHHIQSEVTELRNIIPQRESSLELPWGSHCLGTLFLTLLGFRFSPPLRPIPKHPTYSPKESSLELPWGSHCLGILLPYWHLDFIPPYDPFQNPPTDWVVSWLVVQWAYLPFGTFDHEQSIFVKFLVL